MYFFVLTFFSLDAVKIARVEKTIGGGLFSMHIYIYMCVYMHSVALCETECVYRGVPPAYIDYARGDCLA